MRVFSLTGEQEWNPKRHVEKILDRAGAGDVSVACWEPGQISPCMNMPTGRTAPCCFASAMAPT